MWRIAIVVMMLASGCAGSRGRASHGAARDEPRVAALRAKLAPVDGLVAEGKLDDAMFLLASFTGHERARPEFTAVAHRHEARIRAELERRIAGKAWGRAYALATLSKTVFAGYAEQVAATGKAWADELRPAIAEAERGGRPATAIVLRAALVAATLDYAGAGALATEIEALRDERRLAVEVPAGTGQSVRAAIDAHARFTSRGKRGGDRIVVTLGRPAGATKVTKGKSSVRVEQGKHSVPNPARAAIEDRIATAEQEITYRRDELATEQSSSTRSQSSIDTIKYQIEVAQGDLEAARQDLANTPATVEQQNFVDVPFDVETHTLTVSRDVTLEVTAPWAGDAARQQKTVTAQRSDTANAANKALGVRADPVQLPAASELEPDLDAAAAAWLQAALDKVATRYVRDLAARDPKDGAALAIVLAPESATPADLAALEAVPFAARLVYAVPSIAKRNTSPFRETPVAARAATEPARLPATTKPTTPATPATPLPTTKTAPTPTAKSAPMPTAKPIPAADPLRAKAGYTWTIKPFDIKNAGRIVASITADGTLIWKLGKERVVAVFKPGGIVEDPEGKLVLVVDARGDVWTPRDRVASGTLSKRDLSFPRGGTMSVDRSGHLVIAADGKQQVSNAVVPASAPLPIVLVTGWLAMGAFEFRAR